jgi:P27 family predicted phage terminase small subunit
LRKTKPKNGPRNAQKGLKWRKEEVGYNGIGGGSKKQCARLQDVSKDHGDRRLYKKRCEIERSLTTSDRLICPRELSEGAKREWRRITKLYKSLDETIICDLDRQSMIMHCNAVAIYETAQNEYNKYGGVTSADKEQQMAILTCLRVMKEQSIIISRLAKTLLLDPGSRSSLSNIKAKNLGPSALSRLIMGDDD